MITSKKPEITHPGKEEENSFDAFPIITPVDFDKEAQNDLQNQKLKRFPSGEVQNNLENRRARRATQEKERIMKGILNYDSLIQKGRGTSPEQKQVVKIVESLVETTKKQKNRANVTQLLREGTLSIVRSRCSSPKKEIGGRGRSKSGGKHEETRRVDQVNPINPFQPV